LPLQQRLIGTDCSVAQCTGWVNTSFISRN